MVVPMSPIGTGALVGHQQRDPPAPQLDQSLSVSPKPKRLGCPAPDPRAARYVPVCGERLKRNRPPNQVPPGDGSATRASSPITPRPPAQPKPPPQRRLARPPPPYPCRTIRHEC